MGPVSITTVALHRVPFRGLVCSRPVLSGVLSRCGSVSRRERPLLSLHLLAHQRRGGTSLQGTRWPTLAPTAGETPSGLTARRARD